MPILYCETCDRKVASGPDGRCPGCGGDLNDGNTVEEPATISQPEVPEIPVRPKERSGFAIASLILGIGGFLWVIGDFPWVIGGFLWVLCCIPAIVFGHIAISKIKKRSLSGRGMAIAGLVLGYLGTLAFPGYSASQYVVDRHRTARAREVCETLDRAVLNFYDEYDHLPGTESGDTTYSTANNEGNLITVLLGIEADSGRIQNPKKIRFFAEPRANSRTGGLRYTQGIRPTVRGLLDPWGRSYYVVLDNNYDEVLWIGPRGAEVTGEKLSGRRVATYSFGKNGRNDGGEGDDIRSW